MNYSTIDPDDKTLTRVSKSHQRTWVHQVAAQLTNKELLTDGTTLVFQAGKDYYAELLPLIEETNVTVQIPTPDQYPIACPSRRGSEPPISVPSSFRRIN